MLLHKLILVILFLFMKLCTLQNITFSHESACIKRSLNEIESELNWNLSILFEFMKI